MVDLIRLSKGTLGEYDTIAEKLATESMVPDNNTLYVATDKASVWLGNTKLTSIQELAAHISNYNALEAELREILEGFFADEDEGITTNSVVDRLDDLLADNLTQENNPSVNADTDAGDFYVVTELAENRGIVTIAGQRLLKKVAETAAAEDINVADENEYFEDSNGDGTGIKTLESIINQLVDKINGAKTDSALTIERSVPEGLAARYTFSQGGVPLTTTIDIQKDLVVQSGEIITVGTEEVVLDDTTDPITYLDAGTYIKLVIANKESTPLYINVAELIDIYTGKDLSEDESDTQVQITVTGYQIQADIIKVDGSLINTQSIAKTKLSLPLQTSIDSADSAVQTIETPAAEEGLDGTIKVVNGGGNVEATTTYVKPKNLKDIATSGMATDVVYRTAVPAQDAVIDEETGEEITPAVAAKPAVSVKDELDYIEGMLGEGGGVADQITAKIEELDSTVEVTESTNQTPQVIVGISQVDGLLDNVDKIDLTAENVAYSTDPDDSTTYLSVKDKIDQEVANAAANLTEAIEELDSTIEITTANDGQTKKVLTGVTQEDGVLTTATTVDLTATNVTYKYVPATSTIDPETSEEVEVPAQHVTVNQALLDLEGYESDTKDSSSIVGAKKYAEDLMQAGLTWGSF